MSYLSSLGTPLFRVKITMPKRAGVSAGGGFDESLNLGGIDHEQLTALQSFHGELSLVFHAREKGLQGMCRLPNARSTLFHKNAHTRSKISMLISELPPV